MNSKLSIKEAAQILGISAKTLRRWETSGVFVPQRTSGGQRRYSLEELKSFKKPKRKIVIASPEASPAVSNVLSTTPLPPPNLGGGVPPLRDEGDTDYVRRVLSAPILPKQKTILAWVFGILLLTGLGTGIVKAGILSHVYSNTPLAKQTEVGSGTVLAAESTNAEYVFKVNVPAIFSKDITAPNVVYGITAGNGITIAGTAQNPIISANATASNSAFAKVVIGTKELSAKSVSDSITFVGGDNVSISTDTTTNKITISATDSQGLTGTVGVGNGGTGLTTVAVGDLLYGSATDTYSNLPIGLTGQVLTVSGGVPTWAASSGTCIGTCVDTAPSATQTIVPSSSTATGLSIAQALSGSVDIFNVTNNNGSTKYIQVDNTGVVNILNLDPGTVAGFTLSGNIVGSGSPTISGLGSINGASLSGGSLTGGTYTSNGLSVSGSYTVTIGSGNSFNISNGTTNIFTINDVSGSIGASGDFTISKDNAALILDASTAGETDFWTGIRNNINGLSDDSYQIGTGTTTGTNSVFTLSAAGDLALTGSASASGNLTLAGAARNIQTTSNNSLTIGGNTTGNIFLSPANGATGAYIAPTTNNQVDLGTPSLIFRTIYAQQVIPAGNGTSGYFQRSDGVLSPTYISDDFAIGGIATASAKFQIFGGTGNASSAGSLTFSGNTSTIATTENKSLSINPNGGNVGIGAAAPAEALELNGRLLFDPVTAPSSTTNRLYNVAGNLTWNGYEICHAGNSCSSTGTAGLSGSPLAGQVAFFSSTTDLTGDNQFGWDSTNNLLGIGTTSPVFKLDVTGAVTGKALAVFNETGDQNLLVASASGVAKFIVDRSGNLTSGTVNGQTISSSANLTGSLTVANNFTLSAGTLQTPLSSGAVYSNAGVLSSETQLDETRGGTGLGSYTTGDLLYASGTDTLAKRAVGNNGDILTVVAGVPSWAAVPNGSPWSTNNGTIYQNNTTLDVLIGGTATSSAKFAFLNNNSGTPTASIAGDLVFSGAARTIQTTALNTLTIGGSTTGNIVLDSGSNVITLTDATTALDNFTVSGTTTLNGQFALGDNGDTGAINTSDWDISLTGDLTNIGGITMDGAFLQSGSTTFGTGTGAVSLNGAVTAASSLAVTGTTSLNGIANVGDGGDAITLSGTTITLTPNGAGNDITFNLVDNNTDALDIQESTRNYININTTNGSENVSLGNASTNPTYSLLGSGSLTVGSLNTAGAVIYAQSGGTLAATAQGISGQVLQSNGSGTPTWVDAAGVGTNYWQRSLGVLAPSNITDDLVIGASATSSAKFQVFGGTGNVTATGTFNSQTISSAANFTGSLATNGQLTVTGKATGQALAIFNETGDQSLITASASGVQKFTVDRNGLITTASVNSASIVDSSIANGDLANSSITFGTQSGSGAISLGGTVTINGGGINSSSYSAGTITITGTEADTLAAVTGRGATTTTLSNFNGGLTSTGAVTGLALIRLNQTGDQDILTASAAGVQKFTVSNAGLISTASVNSTSIVDSSINEVDLNATNGPSGGYILSYDNGGGFTWISNSGGSGASKWQLNGNVLAPLTTANQVVLGGNTSTNFLFELNGAISGKALSALNETGDQDILVASNSGTNVFRLQRTGDLLLSSSVSNADKLLISPKNSGSNTFTGTITSADLTADRTWTLPNDSGTVCLTSGNCAGVGGSISGSGTAGQIAFFSSSSGVTSEASGFAWDATNNKLGIGNDSPIGKLDISGAVAGKALVIINETGDSDLLTASSAGVQKFTVSNAGLISTASVNSASVVDGSIANGDLVNSALTLGSQSGSGTVSLGGTLTLNGAGIATTAISGSTYTITATEADTLGTVTGRGATTTTLSNFNGGLTSTGAVTGLALVRINETGDQNLITASASGVQKFSVDRSGNVYAAGLSTGAVYNTNGTLASEAQLAITRGGTNGTATPTLGQVAYGTGTAYAFTTSGATGQVLSYNSGSAPTWVDTSTFNFWQRNAGVISPLNIADDLAIGSTATASAKFQIFGGTGNATTSGTLTFTGTTAQIGTTSKQTLTLGNATTGNIVLDSGSNVITLTDATTALDNFTVSGTTTLNGQFALGDNGDTGAINTSDWDISLTGDLTNIGGITMDGAFLQSGSTTFGTGTGAVSLNGAVTAASSLAVTGTTSLNGIANVGDGGDAITLSGTTITLTPNGAGNDITFNLVDNNTDALDIQESTRNYININTTDSSENISLGNATTNPSFSFLGSGLTTHTGGVTVNGTTTLNGQFTLGDNGDTGAIDTSDWNISLTGDITGAGAITADGTITFSALSNGAAYIASGVVTTEAQLDETRGGTGIGSYTTGDFLYASGTDTLAKRAIGSAGQVLTVVAGVPNWVGGTGSGATGWWQRAAGVVAPSNITDDLVIGGVATASGTFQVSAASGDIQTDGDITVSGGDIIGASTTNIANAATTLNLGSTNVTRSINIGTGTNGDTINIGTGGTTADTITIGNNASTTALNLTSGTGSQTFSSAVVSGSTTTSAFSFLANSLTTGTAQYLASSSLTTGKLFDAYSTSSVLTTGKLGSFNWEPSTPATASGDLVSINIGAAGDTTGNLFNITDSGTSLFSVSTSQITSALPHSFTSSGDVTIANDLNFSNPTAAYISYTSGPGYIRTYNPSANLDLTLSAANLGDVVISDSLVVEGAQTGRAMAVFNEIGNQDILTGSASGVTEFFFSRTGDLTLAGDMTIRGGDLITSTTSFNLLTAATTLSVGAGSGTTTINNGLTVTGTTTTNGTLTVNSDTITLGNAITDAMTFTARVAQDADLIPITATGTNDLGTALLPWDTLYVGTIPGFTLSGTITGSGSPTLTGLGTINGATLSGGTLSGGTYSNTGLTVTGSYTATIGNAGTFAWSDGSNTLMSLVDDGTSGNLGLGTTPVHKLHLSGAVTGKALAVFNETGDQNIFSASQSGISVFNLARIAGTAANGFTLTPATTGNAPTFAATGSDTNIGLNFNPKGTGTVTTTSAVTTGSTTTSAFSFLANSLTSGTGEYLASSSLTTGRLFEASSTSTALTTGKLGYFNWEPATPATASGDLVNINIGAAADTTGNLFNITDAGTSLFSVSTSSITSGLPHSFTAAGDVSMAYDLIMTNQTASYIKSYGPLSIESGESFENNNLTLKTYGTGKIVLDLSGTGSLSVQGQATGGFSSVFYNNDGVSSGEHFIANFGRSTGADVNSVLIGYRADGSNSVGGVVRAGDNDPLYLGTSTTPQAISITDAGKIGIGTTSPLATLHVTDSQTATASAYITNTNTAAGITGLAIKLSSTTLDTTSRFINFLDKNGTRIGKINAANTTTVAYSANGTDMAEYFSKDGSNPQVGDIVSYSSDSATKTTVGYDPQLLGIVSDSAGFVGGEEGPNKVLVALVGQVPVKINPNSPAIAKGDFITSSSVAGLGTKATHAGFVIGKALENWNPGGPNTIKVYINNIWADPTNQLAFDETGNLAIAGQVTAQDFKVNSLVNSINDSLNLINDQFASVSAEIADLKFQVANATGSANIDNLWSYATESGKLSTIYNVQTGNLDVIGKLKVGLLAFDDLDASIESLTGVITAKGDLFVEGKVTASKYNVDTTNVLGASLGKAVIPAGQTELVISTSAASTTSAIFVTPEIYAIPVATEATQAGEFVIRLPFTIGDELKVNWWIIN